MSKTLLAVDIETKGLDGDIIGLALVGDNYKAAFSAEDIQVHSSLLQHKFNEHTVIFHNSKFDLKHLRRAGFIIDDYHDTMILAHLLNPMAPCGLDAVARRYLGEGKQVLEGDKGVLEWTPEVIEYCLKDTELTYKVCLLLLKALHEDASHTFWYQTYELPYVEVIMEMERTGLVVDRNATIETINKYQDKLEEVLSDVRSIVPFVRGEEKNYKKGYYTKHGVVTYNHCSLLPFNPASGPQVATVLQERYGWVPEKLTEKGGICTEADVLEELDYPIIPSILLYKDYQKAISTYLEAFIEHSEELIGPYGVLFGSFNQCGAITGRLSSSSPNLQNVWSSGYIGNTIRSLVTTPPGYKIISIDLSNIEARVLAHYLSKVFRHTTLSSDFAEGRDFHQENADAWGCSRSGAKTALYGLLYGCGARKLASQLSIPVEDAKALLERIYDAMPIKDLKEQLWEVCRARKGYIYTCMGRRLYYPHINSNNHEKRAQAERQTFNALLQGGAADILKVLTLSTLPEAHKLGAYLAASIHDELLFYCPEENTQELSLCLNAHFKTPLLSHCPIEGTAKTGNSWLEVH